MKAHLGRMKMIIAAMNGSLEPSPRTETICRVALIVTLVSFAILMISALTGY